MKTKIYLIRHGKSKKVFPGSESMSFEGKEMLRPLKDVAYGDAREEGMQIAKNNKKILIKEINKKLPFKKISHNIHLWSSGRYRSLQTLIAITEGIEKYLVSNGIVDDPEKNDGLTASPINYWMSIAPQLGYIMTDEFYNTLKRAVKNGEYPSSVEYMLNVSSENFEGRVNSGRELQENMRSFIKYAVDYGIFSEKPLQVAVGHEPCLSLSNINLTETNLDELGGKMKELERIIIEATKSPTQRFPDVGLIFREKTYDIGGKLYR